MIITKYHKLVQVHFIELKDIEPMWTGSLSWYNMTEQYSTTTTKYQSIGASSPSNRKYATAISVPRIEQLKTLMMKGQHMQWFV